MTDPNHKKPLMDRFFHRFGRAKTPQVQDGRSHSPARGSALPLSSQPSISPAAHQAQETQKVTGSQEQMESQPRTDAESAREGSGSSPRPKAVHGPANVSTPATFHSISLDLWNQAYESLKTKHAALVGAYETVLSDQMTVEGAMIKTASQVVHVNLFVNCTGRERFALLESAVRKSVEKAKKHEAIKAGIMKTTEIVTSFDKIVGSMLGPYPPAAMAWSGICAILGVLVKPFAADKEMLEGLSHVVSRMDWYLDLANVLLADKWESSELFAKFRDNMQQKVVELYASLLEFEMKAVAYCFHDHPVVKGVKTMAGFNDWKGHREAVQLREASVKEDLDRYTTQEVIQHLRSLSISAEKLPNIVSGIALIVEHYNSKEKEKALRQQAEKQTKRNQLIGQFKTTAYEERMKFNPERVPGTCEWFREHDKFTKWHGDARGLLLVSADPGCGKSVLARYLIEKVLPGPETAVSYYFFKDNLEQRKLANALCALLHSILSSNSNLVDACEDMVARAGADLYSNSLELWGIFERVVQVGSQTQQMVCVLDALDECDPGELRTLLGLLRRSWISSPSENQEGRAKLLITTRGYPQILDEFASYPLGCIRLSGDSVEEKRQIQAEIRLVIDDRLSQLTAKKRLSAERQAVIRRALYRSDGDQLTYLWVKLMFEVLERNFDDTPTAWQALIASPPATIFEVYEKLLKGVKVDAAERVRLLVNIIIAAERPLTLREMNVAICVHDEIGGADSELDLELASDENFQRWLIQICGFFVTVYDDSIFFIHQTAKEFLLRKESDKPHESMWQSSVTMREAHQLLAESCISYLSLDVFTSRSFKKYVADAFQEDEEFSLRPIMASPSGKYSSFFDYAVRIWPDHFRSAQDFKESAVRDIDDKFNDAYFALFTDERPLSKPWLVMALGVSERWDLGSVYRLLQPVEAGAKLQCVSSLSVAAVAALFGHFRLLQQFLRPNSDGAPQQDETLSNEELDARDFWRGIPDIRHQPLFFATAAGRLECLRYILSQNVEVDATDSVRRTPLLIAAQRREYLAADLLIANGADVNAVDDDGDSVLLNMIGTAVDLAEYDWSNLDDPLEPEGLRETGYKYIETLRRLVERGAKYEDKSRTQKGSGTLLHFAVKFNFESSMLDEIKGLTKKLRRESSNLTDFAADVSKSKRLGDAYERSLVKLLIKHGEGVDSRDGYGATPLYCACVKEHLIWNALFLLRAGADIEAGANSGFRPLHAACALGNAATVAVLLEHGADITARGESGRTALHVAGSVEVLHLLLRALESRNNINSSPLMDKVAPDMAAGRKNDYRHMEDDAPKCPLDNGVTIDVRDDAGQTPLHIICSWDDRDHPPKVDVARLLLANGADVRALDDDNMTPLDLASTAHLGDSDCSELLPLVELLRVHLGMPVVDREEK